MIHEMQDPSGNKLHTITDLTPAEVFGVATLYSYAKIFKSTVIVDWLEKFQLLRISRLRLGRRENLMMATGVRELAEDRRRKSKPQDLFTGLK
jgi:hypothetical protein